MRNWPNVVAVRGLATRLNLATMKQTLKDLDADSSVAVPKLRKRRRRERDLGERGQALVDEPLKPAQRRSLVTRHVRFRQQLAEEERVGK
jgi:hypothetical protein